MIITQDHLDGFAAVSGDDNPIHVDPDFAAHTAFRYPVAHGMFLFGLVCAAVQRRRPDAHIAEQELMFPAPTPTGTSVTVVITGADGTGTAAEIACATSVVHADGTVGLQGRSLLRRPRRTAARSAHISDVPRTAMPRSTVTDGPPARPIRSDDRAAWWEHAVGRSAHLTRAYTADDIATYAALTEHRGGDGIPEPLIAGLFSTLLGVHLPGPGTNYLKQSVRFVAAAAVGEPLTATVRIARTVPDKRLVYLDTSATGAGGRLLADGRALVLAGGIARAD